MIRICRTNSDNLVFQVLIKELDTDLVKRNGDSQFSIVFIIKQSHYLFLLLLMITIMLLIVYALKHF